MKATKILLSILLLTPFLYAKEFVVNSKNSKANFQLTYQKTNIVDGSFQDISGLIIFDEKENIIKSIKGSVDTDSVSTQNGELTSLIISEKILNSKKYPEIEFKAEKITDNKESEVLKDMDNSFYTKSMDLSDKDFDFSDVEDKKVPIIVKILLILILIAVIAATAYYLYYKF